MSQEGIDKEKERPILEVWKTVTLGRRISGREYRAVLDARGITVNDDADVLLDMMPIGQGEVDLVIVTEEMLGEAARDKKSLDQLIQDWGLEKCPAEVGPALLLAGTLDSSSDRVYRIGMDPIEDTLGHPVAFVVDSIDGQQELRGLDLYSGGVWPKEWSWIFMKPRAVQT
jgi:hypothetical protein